jgi:hypothetical protein
MRILRALQTIFRPRSLAPSYPVLYWRSCLYSIDSTYLPRHHHHPLDEPTLELLPATVANIPDEDVPFHDGCVVPRPWSDLHNICSTPTFATPAPIWRNPSVAGIYPGDLYIYPLYYVCYTLAEPTKTAHSRATMISNLRCTNVELPL